MAELRFLVVDDATFIRDLIKKTLRDNYFGCTIQDFNSAKRAQAAVKGLRFDIILCDLEMPDMSGKEFLDWVRGLEGYEKTPFIMVSSTNDKKSVVTAIEAGANDFVGKPFTPDDVVTKINKQLNRIGKGSWAAVNKDATSLDALMGGGSKRVVEPEPEVRPAPRRFKGQVKIDFGNGDTLFLVADINESAITGLIKREAAIPTVLTRVSVKLDEATNAELPGYIFSSAASEARIDCTAIRLTINFDKLDGAQVSALRAYIAAIA